MRILEQNADDVEREALIKLHGVHKLLYEAVPEAFEKDSGVGHVLTEEERKRAEEWARTWKEFAEKELEGIEEDLPPEMTEKNKPTTETTPKPRKQKTDWKKRYEGRMRKY